MLKKLFRYDYVPVNYYFLVISNAFNVTKIIVSFTKKKFNPVSDFRIF